MIKTLKWGFGGVGVLCYKFCFSFFVECTQLVPLKSWSISEWHWLCLQGLRGEMSGVKKCLNEANIDGGSGGLTGDKKEEIKMLQYD